MPPSRLLGVNRHAPCIAPAVVMPCQSGVRSMTQDAARDLVTRRDALIARIVTLARSDDRFQAAWLQGSIARADSDPYSDVDAYLAVEDDAVGSVWNDR